MSFSAEERALLLQVPWVGPSVVTRLEEMGFQNLSDLATANVNDVLQEGAELTGSSCWANSPQARRAISGAITAAQPNSDKPE